MSKHDDVRYCDFSRCHLIIAPKDPGQLNYGSFDFHGACFLALQREQKAEEQKDSRQRGRMSCVPARGR